ISLSLYPGEVLGLLGDNGAGKSTLMKIISGVIPADAGQISIRGTALDIRKFSVAGARESGIESVHQDRALGEKQPIWRNLFLGRHLTCPPFGFIRRNRERKETMALLKDLLGFSGAGISPDAPVSILSGGERQGLAIGRAIYFDAEIVLLDEPCTALALAEVKKVQQFIRSLKDDNRSAILISHNISQVYEVSDRFICLNRGRTAGSFSKEDTNMPTLTRHLMALSS
ncbi:MAG: ATP-binding cassette domain-containing protein, partial [Desulfobacterales bacterium]|nr:ATP-binding cassette domain-containing protein [Desulfobacterales bacterium]